MIFGYTADFHFAKYSQDPLVKGLPERLYFLNVTIRNMIKWLNDRGIYTLIVGGDTIHTKSIIHSFALSMFLDIIRENTDTTFIIIDGNHDLSARGSDGVSAIKALDSEPNVITIHKPRTIDNILFVPWNTETMIDDIKNGEAEYLVSHFGLDEAQLSSGISIVSDISINDLKQYRVVLLGHYHNPQEIIRGDVKVWYVGDPIQLDWGEKGEEKRFLSVDTHNHDVQSIPTVGYRKHIEYELTGTNKIEILEEAKKAKEEGHHIKINKIEKVDTSDFKEFRVIDKVEKDITNRGIDTSMSESDRLDKYMEIKEIPEEKRDDYRKEALDIINSCIGE